MEAKGGYYIMAREIAYMDQMTCHVPNEYVEKAIALSMDQGEYQQYAPPKGLPKLHELVLKDFDLEDTDAEVCVTDGSLPAIYQSIKYACHPDIFSEFLDSEPAWGWPRKYSGEANLLSLVDSRKIIPDDIKKHSFLNICSPQNPIGFAYTVDELIALGKRAAVLGAWVLQDCTYKDYVDDYYPLYKLNPDRTLTTFSFSKSPGMAGLRVGGVICSKRNMEQIFTLRPNQLGSGFPGQRAACDALMFKDKWLPKLRDINEANKKFIYSSLPWCSFPTDDKGNSVWIELPEEIDSSYLTEQLFKEKIQIRDGIYYKQYGYKGNFVKVGTAVPPQWISTLCASMTRIKNRK
jgi:aspartate/methionine/tyrosine aminotransferase